ncbi:MAG: hypothetical protein ABIV48_02200 [Pyrinomonadaceae bacterium]
MSTKDTCCTVVPYFKVPAKNMEAFRSLCEQFVAKTMAEPKCLYYGFSFDGDEVHCREGYVDADGVLAHLGNVGDLLAQALNISEVIRLEVHGPEDEIAKLREPLATFGPRYYSLEYGFRR